MEKHYYNADSLRRSLDALEKHYGMRSEDFYDAYVEYDEDRLRGISGFYRHSWASFYRDWRRLSGDEFASGVERALEIA